LDPILVTDSITVLEANTIPVDRSISDHDPIYIDVDCGNKNSKSYTRTVWLYNQGNNPLFRQLISNTDWESIISEQPTVDIVCKLFTGKFMEITHECIGTYTVTIRPNDNIWMTSEIRRELRVRDRLRKNFIQNKPIFNERKNKDQCNKVNNLKKSAKLNSM